MSFMSPSTHRFASCFYSFGNLLPHPFYQLAVPDLYEVLAEPLVHVFQLHTGKFEPDGLRGVEVWKYALVSREGLRDLIHDMLDDLVVHAEGLGA